MSNKELTREINALADRLDRDEVAVLDVLVTLHRPIKTVTGQPHLSIDDPALEAAQRLGVSIVTALERQKASLVMTISKTLGRNIAFGVLGVPFFRNLDGRGK